MGAVGLAKGEELTRRPFKTAKCALLVPPDQCRLGHQLTPLSWNPVRRPACAQGYRLSVLYGLWPGFHPNLRIQYAAFRSVFSYRPVLQLVCAPTNPCLPIIALDKPDDKDGFRPVVHGGSHSYLDDERHVLRQLSVFAHEFAYCMPRRWLWYGVPVAQTASSGPAWSQSCFRFVVMIPSCPPPVTSLPQLVLTPGQLSAKIRMHHLSRRNRCPPGS
jgi:hypothetical protein